MKATIGRAVDIAYRALGDLVEPCVVNLREKVDFDWTAVSPAVTVRAVPADVVFVDEQLNAAREKVKKLWAILKFKETVPQFSEIVVGTKRYRCDAPLVSYRFIVMVEVHEIQ